MNHELNEELAHDLRSLQLDSKVTRAALFDIMAVEWFLPPAKPRVYGPVESETDSLPIAMADTVFDSGSTGYDV